MFAERLVLGNVRCFAHAEVPLDARVTVIIGANGAGKTTIAEALASLAPGEREGLDELPLRRGATSGEAALLGAGGEVVARFRAGAPRERLPRGQHVFVYGQYRALRPPPGKRAPLALLDASWEKAAARPLPQSLADADRRPAAGTLFGFDEYLFRDLGAYVALLADQGAYDPGARSAWERLRAWLRQLDERLGEVVLREEEGRRVAAFERAGLPLSLGDLSDGYRAVLAVAIDLVIRYVQLFAGRDDPLGGEALVVIDEIDLNLHPRWQRRVIDQLTRLLPGTRFVLTTHSPTVVQAAIDERHRVLVLDEMPPGETRVRSFTKADLRRLDGAEVDSVLVDRAAFWVGSRYSLKYERLEEEARALRGKLEREEATARDERRLLAVLDRLRRLAVKEEVRAGKGPMLSEIAEAHLALLKQQMARTAAAKKGAKRRG